MTYFFILKLSGTKVQHSSWFQVGLHFWVKHRFGYKHWSSSVMEKDFSIVLSVYCPSFEFNPGYWLKMMAITLFYSGPISPVFQFLLHWKNEKNLSQCTCIQVHSCHKDPIQMNCVMLFQVWLILSSATFYSQMCSRKSGLLTRARQWHQQPPFNS